MSGTGTIVLVLAGLALGIALGWKLSHRSLTGTLRELRSGLEQAKSEARTDPLTGLWNRKAFDEQIAILAAISRRYGGPMSMVLFDIDALKQINDVRGHAAGDAALVYFARVLDDSSRESDFPARLGGDEFAVLLPQTAGDGAFALAERVYRNLETRPCELPATGSSASGEANLPQGSGGLILRASAGIAEFDPELPLSELLERADKALYRAKQSGGNVCHEAKVTSKSRGK